MIEQREKQLKETAEAVRAVEDGMVVAIGGFNTAAKPLALIRELIRQGRKDLTIVATPSGLEVDLLIGCRCVKHLITPSVGFEVLGAVGPLYLQALENGEIKVSEIDYDRLLSALEAAAQNSSSRNGLEGSNDLLPGPLCTNDRSGNGALSPLEPIVPDVALLHASQADVYGNVQHLGRSYGDSIIARAARHTIVSVERIVGREAVRSGPDRTTITSHFVNSLVHAPYGAHPGFSQGHYVIDRAHMGEYLSAAEARLGGDATAYDRYIDRYVFAAPTLSDYLEMVGAQQLLGLKER